MKTWPSPRRIALAATALLLAIAGGAAAADLRLAWDAPTNNADGSAATDLAGYRIYYGPSSGDYTTMIDVGCVTETVITNLAEGLTCFVAATAYGTNTLESVLSDEFAWQAPDLTPPTLSPPAPTNCQAGADGMAALPDLVARTVAMDNVSSGTDLVVTQFPVAGSLKPVGTHSVTITARDAAGNQSQATAIVNVVAENRAPLVNAGADMTVRINKGVSLAGTVSDDQLPAGAGLTIIWRAISGPGTVAFDDAAAPATTATFSADGNYTLQLTASDSLLSASDNVVITVLRGSTPKSPRNVRIIAP